MNISSLTSKHKTKKVSKLGVCVRWRLIGFRSVREKERCLLLCPLISNWDLTAEFHILFLLPLRYLNARQETTEKLGYMEECSRDRGVVCYFTFNSCKKAAQRGWEWLYITLRDLSFSPQVLFSFFRFLLIPQTPASGKHQMLLSTVSLHVEQLQTQYIFK